VPTQTLVLDKTAPDQTYISQISYTSMKLSTFLVNGCPTSLLPLDKCETYNGLQFATFCYLPLKLMSQLIHLHNICNAFREILTVRSQHDIYKISKIVKQANLGELSLDCRSPS
jgi:hypothetical protein